MWPEAQTAAYIVERVTRLESAKREYASTGAVSIDCSPQETWNDGPSYAVMKRGNKRAVKVSGLESIADAEASIASHAKPEGRYAETRPGRKMNRCHSRNGKSYCILASNGRCPQFRRFMETVAAERDGDQW